MGQQDASPQKQKIVSCDAVHNICIASRCSKVMLPNEHQETPGHSEGDHVLAEAAQIGDEVSILGEIQKLSGQNLGRTALMSLGI